MSEKKEDVFQEVPDIKDDSEISSLYTSTESECLMTTREMMAFLNLSRTKIWELVNKSGMPAFKFGGDYRYKRSEILEWMEKFRVHQIKNDE